MASFITVGDKLIEGTFQKRLNRFLVLANIKGKTTLSYLPNPGRMGELLTPETKVLLREVSKTNRKTCYDLIGVFSNKRKVSIDSRLALSSSPFIIRCLTTRISYFTE